MTDEDIAYLSPSTVYNILKKHDLIAERKVKYREITIRPIGKNLT